MIFRTLIGLLICMIPFSGHAQSSFGKKLELVRKNNGSLHFGLSYALNPTKALAITFSVAGDQLIATKHGGIFPSYWAIVNKDTMTTLTPWKPTGVNGPFSFDAKVAMSLAVDQAIVSLVLKSLNSSVLVLSLNTVGEPIASAYIDLAELCVSSPGQFLNLDSFETGCK